MGKQLRRMSEEEIIAMAMRRADAEYEAAVARGKARFEREQAREQAREQTPTTETITETITTPAAETITMECPNCGGLGIIRTFAVRWFNVPCDVCDGKGYGVEMPREASETTETTAADAVAEMRECEVCGQVRADCASQTPARETEVADIFVCADCRDALAELSF